MTDCWMLMYESYHNDDDDESYHNDDDDESYHKDDDDEKDDEFALIMSCLLYTSDAADE